MGVLRREFGPKRLHKKEISSSKTKGVPKRDQVLVDKGHLIEESGAQDESRGGSQDLEAQDTPKEGERYL